MRCPVCNAAVVTFAVPEEYRGHLPAETGHAGLCSRCLRLHPAEEGGGDFGQLGEEFPADPDVAVPMAIAIGLLDSLALNRRDIEALLDVVIDAGVDPILVVDRLQTQGSTDPAVDLNRRMEQLQQLIEANSEEAA
jgi:hypothetical protein